MTILLAPMEGLLDFTLRDVLTRVGGIDRCVSEFIRVTDQIPNTKAVSGTNYCDLTARVVKGKVLVLAVLDNLIKGASGVAVQNFNLMCGYPEETGLIV